MSGHPAWVPVARWEMFRILRRADFIVSVLITPLLAVGGGLLGGWMKGAPADVAVVWLAPSGEALPPAQAPVLPARDRVVWRPAPDSGADRDALRRELASKRLDGALVVPFAYADADSVEVLSRRGNPPWKSQAVSAVREQARLERAAARGLDSLALASIDRPLAVADRPMATPRPGSSRAERLALLALIALMMAVQFSTISYLMIGISGEKQARVTEVVVSAVPAQAWMDGKLVAFTVIGLVMAVVWAGSAVIAALMFRLPLPAIVNPLPLLVTLAYTILGLYLYNALFAGLMATLQGIQSTSKFQGYFFMLPFAPFLLMGPLMDDPETTWLAAVSLVPLMSSSLVPARLMSDAIPAWQVVVGLALLVAACWWMRLFAGRIFRMGMLLYGKDLTLPEIVRWAREK